jgi:winged helix DNA-binding protein
MTAAKIISLRLSNQQLIESSFTKPEDVVSHLVAMQAQEFAMAKWAIHLRSPGTTEAAIQTAFNSGLILRTHLMRPTWHFVVPADIRWLVALTAPRVHGANAFMYRQLKIDNKLLLRSNKIITKSLEGSNHLTRNKLQAILEKNKIVAEGPRLGYIMMNAELEGIICSGPRQGNQFTYALLEERAAPVKPVNREEALYMLIARYFSTRGPATLKDFTTWSGLTMQDAKAGTSMLSTDFIKETIDGQEYIFKPPASKLPLKNFPTFLMPDYDEYGMSYKNRSALFNSASVNAKPKFNHCLVVNGTISGSWQRTVKNNTVTVKTDPFGDLNKKQTKEVAAAVKKYLSFNNSETAKNNRVISYYSQPDRLNNK